MRNLILLTFGVGLAFALSSCTREKPAGEEIINSYESQDGVISLKIPPGLIGMFLTGEKNREAKNALGKMKSIKVILVNAGDTREKNLKDFTRNFTSKVKDSGFEDWLRISENGEQINIFALQEEKNIKEMMVMISGKDGFLGLNLVGEMDPYQLVKIVKKLKPGDFKITN